MFREQLKLNVETIETLDQALCSQISRITVNLENESKYKKFLELVELSSKNPTHVVINYTVEENITVALELGGNFKNQS